MCPIRQNGTRIANSTVGSNNTSVAGDNSMGLILLIILIILLLGALPTWPHSRTWGYAPGGGLGLLLLIVLLLLLFGMLPWGWYPVTTPPP
jgi:hypothetical protein